MHLQKFLIDEKVENKIGKFLEDQSIFFLAHIPEGFFF